MIEVGGAIVATIFIILFVIGYIEESKRIKERGHVPQNYMSSEAEADLYAAFTYQETGEPSAFMLFDHEEPVSAPPVIQSARPTPKPKPVPKPKPARKTNDQDKKIRDLQDQIKQLQKIVSSQQKRPVKNTPKVDPLQQDCVDALVALGYNKTEAKKIVASNLSRDITNVQDFLVIAMRKK